MKTKVLVLVLAGGLVATAAWLVHTPHAVHADEVPEKYRDTLSKGLDYLARGQHQDGHWEGDGGRHPVAVTALAGMALLMDCANDDWGYRQVNRDGKYQANVGKAVDWLIEKSQAGQGGLIYSEHPSDTDRYMYGHGLATMFLAWVYHTDIQYKHHKKIEEVLARAVKYIGSAQSSQKGWHRTSCVEGHDLDEVLATSIQVMALRTRSRDGMYGHEYLKWALGKYNEGAKPGRPRGVDAAAALACRIWYFGNDDTCLRWLKHCQAEIPVGRAMQFGRDELAHYYYAQALYYLKEQGEEAAAVWTKYRTEMFDHLQSSQNKDGSWPHGNLETRDAKGDLLAVGSVFSTAVWCTILQLDKNCHLVAHHLRVQE